MEAQDYAEYDSDSIFFMFFFALFVTACFSTVAQAFTKLSYHSSICRSLDRWLLTRVAARAGDSWPWRLANSQSFDTDGGMSPSMFLLQNCTSTRLSLDTIPERPAIIVQVLSLLQYVDYLCQRLVGSKRPQSPLECPRLSSSILPYKIVFSHGPR